jgi:hypothetical protein
MVLAADVRIRNVLRLGAIKGHLHLVKLNVLVHFTQGHLLLALLQRAAAVFEEGAFIRPVVSFQSIVGFGLWRGGRWPRGWRRAIFRTPAQRPNLVVVLTGYECRVIRMLALDMLGKVLVRRETLSAKWAGLEIHRVSVDVLLARRQGVD